MILVIIPVFYLITRDYLNNLGLSSPNYFILSYNIIAIFKFYFSTNAKPFYLPIFLGILYKLNSIALFLIPIQAIKSVSEGNLSKNLKDVLALLNIFIPPDEYIYLYFVICAKLFC